MLVHAPISRGARVPKYMYSLEESGLLICLGYNLRQHNRQLQKFT